MKIFLSLLLSLLFITNASAQWKEILPPDDIADFLCFKNVNEGIAITSSVDQGNHPSSYWSALSTNNKGYTWQYGGISRSGQGVFCTALVRSRDQQAMYTFSIWMGIKSIDRTTDNGKTWTNINVPSEKKFYINSFQAIDTSHVFYLRSDNVDSSSILKYSKGTYSIFKIPFKSSSETKIICPDTETVYLATDLLNRIYKFTNIHGNIRYQKINSDSLTRVRDVYFSSKNTGYIVGENGKIFKTVDGGQTVNSLNSGTKLQLNSVYFLNDSVGSVAGDSGLVMKTIDGGKTWKRQQISTRKNLSNLYYVNDSVAFLRNSLWVYYKINERERFSDDLSKLTAVDLYPNPTAGIFKLSARQKISTIAIFDALGKQVYSKDIGQTETTIDLRFCKEGIFFICGELINTQIFQKKIVLH